MFVHHQPSKGSGLIWDMFGEQPHTLEVLSLAPDNTAALAHSDLNLKRIIDWADAVFVEMLGGESIMANAPPEVQDILDSFGNEAGVLMTLDSENKMTLPGFMFDREEDLELDGVAFALLFARQRRHVDGDARRGNGRRVWRSGGNQGRWCHHSLHSPANPAADQDGSLALLLPGRQLHGAVLGGELGQAHGRSARW